MSRACPCSAAGTPRCASTSAGPSLTSGPCSSRWGATFPPGKKRKKEKGEGQQKKNSNSCYPFLVLVLPASLHAAPPLLNPAVIPDTLTRMHPLTPGAVLTPRFLPCAPVPLSWGVQGAVQRVDVAILSPSAHTPLVLSHPSQPPSTSSSRERESPGGTAPQGSPGHAGATAEEHLVFQCSGGSTAAESGGRPQGVGVGRGGGGKQGKGGEGRGEGSARRGGAGSEDSPAAPQCHATQRHPRCASLLGDMVHSALGYCTVQIQ